jgi:organic radical activating enzyme
MVDIFYKEVDSMNLRLLVTENCNRNCPGCCNKDWDLKSLQVCTDYTKYDLIMLTGGEPMTDINKLIEVVVKIRQQTDTPIILYTAWLEVPQYLGHFLQLIEGATITLHTVDDVLKFVEFYQRYAHMLDEKSMRLNIFEECHYEPWLRDNWQIKNHMQWIKECPLPENEVFMRYE